MRDDPDERVAYESLIREYYDACNAADAERIAACFEPEAVHYFPSGMYEGPFVGAETIARRWCDAVATLGSYWAIVRIAVDPAHHVAVLEWTHYKTRNGTVLRGDEWVEFDPESGRIREIRAYYASPQPTDRSRLELGGFDYRGRGYSLEPPPGARPGTGRA
jgi:methyltransferase